MLRIFVGLLIALVLTAGILWIGEVHSQSDAELAGHFFPGLLWLLAAIWLSVMVSPYSLQDNLHFEGLALLPVTKTQFVWALAINALVSYTGAFVPLLTLLIVIAFGNTPALAIWTTILLFLFWLGLLIAGQLMLLIFGRILSSRRFTDIAIIVGTIIAFSFYFIRFIFITDSFETGSFSAFTEKFGPIASIAKYFPPGLAGWSYNAMAQGDTFAASATLALVAFEVLALLIAAGYAVERFFIGELSIGSTVRERKKEVAGKGEPFAPGLRLLNLLSASLGYGTGAAGLYVKEWRYLFREPVYKLRVINSLMMFAYFLFFLLFFSRSGGMGGGSGGNGFFVTSYVLPILAYITVLGDLRLAANKFGMDGEAISCLFISPVYREEILFAKSFFGIAVLQTLNAIIIVAGGLLLKAEPVLIVLCALGIFAGSLIVEAWGNVLSVFFPYKLITTSGRRGQPRFESGGCMFQLAYLLATLGTNLLAVPVMAAIILPFYFGNPFLGILLFPVSAGFAAFVYSASLKFAGSKLAERELAIIELMESPAN